MKVKKEEKMERRKVLELNSDEIALLKASLVKTIRQSGGNKTIEYFYPKADIEHIFKVLEEIKNG